MKMENISSLFFFFTVVLGLFPLKDAIHLNDVIASDNASTYFRGQHTLQKKEQRFDDKSTLLYMH